MHIVVYDIITLCFMSMFFAVLFLFMLIEDPARENA